MNSPIAKHSLLRSTLLLLAVFLVLFAVGMWVLTANGTSENASPAGTIHPAQPAKAVLSKTEVDLPERPTRDADLTSAHASGPDVGASEGGDKSGIELYANTQKPFRIGVVVPDDYVLPPGYVRHYQMNDDGTPLPPILMYHPDFRALVDAGADAFIPSDLIVPGDQLPAGIKPLMLEVPKVIFDGGLL
jgi:hypothetical protein